MRNIFLDEIRGSTVSFWTAGNQPTQAILNLDEAKVELHLKAQFLLSDYVLASGSFYWESPITRALTTRFEELFRSEKVLYFLDETSAGFAEHAAAKAEKTPANMACYHDSDFSESAAKELQAIGVLLRRPAISISDVIVELWVEDLRTRQRGTLGSYIEKTTKDKIENAKITQELINIGKKRTKAFVWEYVQPIIIGLGAPDGFLELARSRLSLMYSLVTAEMIGAPVDARKAMLEGDLIHEWAKLDSSLFLNCMEAMGVLAQLRLLDANALTILKSSEEFMFFQFFYRSFVDIALPSTELGELTRIYRSAENQYAISGMSRHAFLKEMRGFLVAIRRGIRDVTKPLEVLVRAFDNFGRQPIAEFVARLKQLSKTSDEGLGVYRMSALDEERDRLIAPVLFAGEGRRSIVEPKPDCSKMPWHNPRMPKTIVAAYETIVECGPISVVILVATDIELLQTLRLLKPFKGYRRIRKVFKDDETYYCGRFGVHAGVVLKCDPGSVMPSAATHVARSALECWKPMAIIMVGIAFGADRDKHKAGDVLVASAVIPYEGERVGDEVKFRNAVPPTGFMLLNRFTNAQGWAFKEPNGREVKLHAGQLLSGEKLIDDPKFKKALLDKHKIAIGGEMEAAGLFAAAARARTEWIVAKGVSDWGDGTKHDGYQELAAAASASLACFVCSEEGVFGEGTSPVRAGGKSTAGI